MKKKIIITIISVFILFILLLICRIYFDSNVIEVSHYDIISEKIHGELNGFKIVQLSDLHSKSFGKGNEKLIALIDAEKPDIVVMTGDMVTANEKSFDTFFELTKNLVAKYEVYYITGNHEQGLSNKYFNMILDYLKEAGVHILGNEHVTIEKGEDSFELFGLWYTKKYYSKSSKNKFTDEKIRGFIGKPQDGVFNLLLTHNPIHFEEYSKWGADLTLSGHVHGGMVRLPLVGAVFSPDEGLFPKYNAGMYENGDDKIIVSRGLGRGSRGFRLFNQPELVVITLKEQR